MLSRNWTPAIAELAPQTIMSMLVDVVGPSLEKYMVRSAKSQQTQQQLFGTSRGRIMPGSSNQEAAAANQASNLIASTQTSSTVVMQLPVIDPSPSGEGSRENAPMRMGVFLACKEGRVDRLKSMVDEHGSTILYTITPHRNTPLHLAAMFGHEDIAMVICQHAPSLLLCQNIHEETPLIAAVMAHNESLASKFINNASALDGGNLLKKMLLKCDRRQENALHHALRNGFEQLAIDIFVKEPLLSMKPNKNGESAMHMACRRGFSEAVDRMLQPSNSSTGNAGSNDQSALDAAVQAQQKGRVGNRNTPSTTADGTSSVVRVQIPDPSPYGEDGSKYATMREDVFLACKEGSVERLRSMVDEHGLDILSTVTPYWNTPLHLAAMFGHEEIAIVICQRAPSLLLCQNIHEETPLIAAVIARQESLASWFINNASSLLKEMLLKCDRRQENALHHALQNGFEKLAIDILVKEPLLSMKPNKNGESAMHMACRRGFSKAEDIMLQLSNSTGPILSHAGPNGQSALDAAIQAQQIGIVANILKHYPEQASHVDGIGNTPLCTAIQMKNLDMVETLLKHNYELAYYANEKDGYTPFLLAANLGYVDIAKKIVQHAPDSAYALTKPDEMNALHEAVQREEHSFVHYILKSPRLRRLINQGDSSGNLPLHYAAYTCNTLLLRSLSSKRHRQDLTAVNANNTNAAHIVYSRTDLFETSKWKGAFEFVSVEISSGVSQLVENKDQMVKQEEKIKSLTQMYTSNSSVVAALLATITFAAAFTLPGGYSTDKEEEGLPVFGRKPVFIVFLLSDTIAMCSSLAVAFFCGLLTWKDFSNTNQSKNLLLNYRDWARGLMWIAYASTLLAFGTGLYTVLAPKCLWLAILIVALCSTLPFISKILSDWPRLKTIFFRWVLLRESMKEREGHQIEHEEYKMTSQDYWIEILSKLSS